MIKEKVLPNIFALQKANLEAYNSLGVSQGSELQAILSVSALLYLFSIR